MAKLHDVVKPEPIAKYEALVEQKLAQARGRIRLLDFTAGFLGFLIGTMIFAVVMGWLDRWLQFSLTTRQAALTLYGIVAVVYLATVFLRPLLRPLNPYYAARQVEHVLPGAKNSVINWLDLRHEQLPSAIRGALGHRAAKDIGQANLEEAINGRRALSLGAVTLVLFLITVAFMFFGPGLGRIFQPIGSNPTTEIHIVKPEGGNGTVAEGRAATIEAVVEGRQTEPLRFHYRHHQTDPYEDRPMERGESADDWVITVPAFEVHNGFWYKLVGTEAATEEYHIEVRSAPAFREFEINYHPRAYLRLPDETVKTHQPDLKGIRGTEVSILARTNRKIRIEESGLLINGQKDTVKAESVPDDSQAMRFHQVLDQDGSYGIQFTSTDGERNNPIFYTITALPDKAPEVRITKPDSDDPISLPANGILQVEGSATDDHGLTGFTLQMQIKPKEGKPEPLPAKPYKTETPFKLADGSYPLALNYNDIVELAKLRLGGPLQPETLVEYWLEATDNCDFPAPNVGRSKSKFVRIKPPESDAQKLEKEKAQAQKEKEKKQAEQEQKLKEQNQAKQQDQPQPQENPGGEQQPSEEKKFQDIQNKLDEQLKQQEKQKNADGSNSDAKKDSDKGEGNKDPKGDGQGGMNDGQPKGKPDKKDADKNEGDKNPKGDKAKGKPEGQPKDNPDKQDSDKGEGANNPQNKDEKGKKGDQPDKQPGNNKDNQDKNSPQNSEPQKQGKDDQRKKDDPKGTQDGGPKPGKDKQDKPDDSKGNQEKKEERKGPGEGSNPTDKNPKDTDPGRSNSNSPPKPGMNEKGPQKEGQSDQPGQEKKVNSPDKKSDSGKPEPEERKGQSPDKGDPSKSDESSKDKTDSKQGTPKDQNNKSSDPKDPSQGQTAKKIGELLKAMKDGDAKTKENARKELEKMSEQAKTPAEREAAKEALKKSDQGSTPGEKSSDDKKDKPGAASGNNEKKGEPSDPDKKASQPGDQKQGENGKPGDGSSPDKKSEPTKESGKGKSDPDGAKGSKGEKGSDQNLSKPGSNPGGPNLGNRENSSGAGGGPEAEPGAEANKEFQKKAGELQLEDYRRKITPDMLQKAKISDQDYKDFLKAYEEKLAREGVEKTKPDPLVDPRRRGSTLTNRASQQPKSTGKKEDKLPQAGRGGAPPGYVESYSEFREKTSRSSPQKPEVKDQK